MLMLTVVLVQSKKVEERNLTVFFNPLILERINLFIYEFPIF